MAIELRLLRYFAVVADELHVGRAAARLFISQPALSQQIRTLEDQVGMPLFVRHPRGMELTEMGEALLREARELLARSDRLERTVEELRRGLRGTLRVGLPPGAPRTLLPDLVAPLRAAHPDAGVEVRELTTPEQLDALHDLLVNAMRDAGVQARFQDSAHLSTTQGLVAAGLGLTFSAQPWLEDVAGIFWRPLADATIEIRTAAAWRSGNRSPLLRALVDGLPS